MINYNKPTAQLVWDQINRDNPGLAKPLNANNVGVLQGPLTSGLQGNRNTKLIITGLPGSGYSGKQSIYYDRLALQSYARNFVPIKVPYRATKMREVLPAFNEAVGLQLTVDDIANPDAIFAPVTTGSGNLILTINANSLSFTGSLYVNWTRMAPSLADIYTKPQIDLWPALDGHTKIYNTDFTPYSSVLTALASGSVLKSSLGTNVTNLINVIKRWALVPVTVGTTPSGAPLDLTDWVLTKITPSTGVPDANPLYSNAVVLTPPITSAHQRPLYLHYGRRDGKTTYAQEADLLRYIALQGYDPEGPMIGGPGSGSVWRSVLPTTPQPSDYMWGSPWGQFVAAGYWSRICQHAFPTLAMFQDSVQAKRRVLVQYNNETGANTKIIGTDRNGYLSETVTINGWRRVTGFIYYDTTTGGYMTVNPFTMSAATAWYPPYA